MPTGSLSPPLPSPARPISLGLALLGSTEHAQNTHPHPHTPPCSLPHLSALRTLTVGWPLLGTQAAAVPVPMPSARYVFLDTRLLVVPLPKEVCLPPTRQSSLAPGLPRSQEAWRKPGEGTVEVLCKQGRPDLGLACPGLSGAQRLTEPLGKHRCGPEVEPSSGV